MLVGQLLEHILRPMAEYFSVQGFIANRLEFRKVKKVCCLESHGM